VLAGAREVLLELLLRALEHRRRTLGLGIPGEAAAAFDREPGDGLAIARDFESADGAVDADEVRRARPDGAEIRESLGASGAGGVGDRG
jgi:hypothetical protein